MKKGISDSVNPIEPESIVTDQPLRDIGYSKAAQCGKSLFFVVRQPFCLFDALSFTQRHGKDTPPPMVPQDRVGGLPYGIRYLPGGLTTILYHSGLPFTLRVPQLI